MKNRVMSHPDDTAVVFSNTGSAIAAGAVVDLGDRFGVAQVDIAATTGTGVVQTAGRFKLPKATGVTFALNQVLRWDAGNTRVSSTTDPAHKVIGTCAKAAASGDTTVEVNLQPGGAAAGGSPMFVKQYVATGGDAGAGFVTVDTGFGAAPTVFLVQARKAASAFLNRVIANVEMLTGGSAGQVKVTITGIETGDLVSVIAVK